MDSNKKKRNNNSNKKEYVKNGKVKKEFNKKAFRNKMYNKKYKILQWENHRRIQILRELEDDIALHGRNYSTDADEPVAINSNWMKSRNNKKTITKRTEKMDKSEKLRRAKQEKELALEKYRHKRTEMYKKISRKTRKGQPVMKDRLEILLQKIQLSRQ